MSVNFLLFYVFNRYKALALVSSKQVPRYIITKRFFFNVLRSATYSSIAYRNNYVCPLLSHRLNSSNMDSSVKNLF